MKEIYYEVVLLFFLSSLGVLIYWKYILIIFYNWPDYNRGGSDRLAEELERKRAKTGNRDRVARTSIGQAKPNNTPNKAGNKAGNKSGGNQNKKNGDNKNKNGQTPAKPKTPTSILKKGEGEKGASEAGKTGTPKDKDDKKKSSEKKPSESAEDKAEGDASEVVVLETDKNCEESEKKDGEVETEKKKKSKYDEFPPGLLVCKVCQKTMNDGGVSRNSALLYYLMLFRLSLTILLLSV